jgi:hypothetical protein
MSGREILFLTNFCLDKMYGREILFLTHFCIDKISGREISCHVGQVERVEPLVESVVEAEVKLSGLPDRGLELAQNVPFGADLWNFLMGDRGFDFLFKFSMFGPNPTTSDLQRQRCKCLQRKRFKFLQRKRFKFLQRDRCKCLQRHR